MSTKVISKQCKGSLLAAIRQFSILMIFLTSLLGVSPAAVSAQSPAFVEPPPEPIGAGSGNTMPLVAIHISEYTAAHWTTLGGPHNDWKYWHIYGFLMEAFQSDGTPYTVLTDANIEAGALLDSGTPRYPIFISLAAACISDLEADQIRAYVQAGGHAYAGSTAWTRDETCQLRGASSNTGKYAWNTVNVYADNFFSASFSPSFTIDDNADNLWLNAIDDTLPTSIWWELPAEETISKIGLWQASYVPPWSYRIRDYQVSLSTNCTDWTPVATNTGQDIPGDYQETSFTPAAARCIRVTADYPSWEDEDYSGYNTANWIGLDGFQAYDQNGDPLINAAPLLFTQSAFALSPEMGLIPSNTGLIGSIQKVNNNAIVSHMTETDVRNWFLPKAYSDNGYTHRQHWAQFVQPTTATVLLSSDGHPTLSVTPYGSGQFIYHSEFSPLAGYSGYVVDNFEYGFFRKAVEQAFKANQAPLVRLSGWPYPYNAAFKTRHDHFLSLAASEIEEEYGVKGEYLLRTDAAIGGPDWAHLSTILANGAQIGSHTRNEYTLDSGGYTAGYDNIHQSLDALETALGTRPKIFVTPGMMGFRDTSKQAMVDNGLITTGDMSHGPYPNFALKIDTATEYGPAAHWPILEIPVGRYYTLPGETWSDLIFSHVGNMALADDIRYIEKTVDLTYDLRGVINVYDHINDPGLWIHPNLDPFEHYISYALSKPHVWNTHSEEIYDWWVGRSTVSIAPSYTPGVQVTVTLTGNSAGDPYALDIAVPDDRSVESVLLDGVPTTQYRVEDSTGGLGGQLKVRAAGAAQVQVIWDDEPAVTQYALTVVTNGQGSVALSPAGGVYDSGTTVELTPVPEAGWSFSGWSDDLSGSDNPAQIVMNGDKTVTATFTLTPATCYTLALSHTGSGSNPSAAPLKSAACAENGKYVAGENIALSGAVPVSGWQISGWTGTANNASTANTNTLVMPAADHTASVQYGEISSNTPPFARDDAYTTAEDTLLDVPFLQGLLLNDNDIDGDLIPAELVTDVSNGTLNLNADGSFTYLPDLNFNGSDSFTYRDFDGQAYSNVATVTLTVTAVNDAPTANAQSVSTVENTAKAVTLTGSDVEGSGLTYAVVTPPAHGTLSGTAPNLTYTPNLNYYGEDSFTFKVNDGELDSTPAAVTITVTKGNSAPVAVDDSYAVDEDLLLSISAPGVLGNDSDEDSDPLTAQLVADVSHGTLSLAANGSFTYQPGANYSGSDTFTYRASDGTALSNTATVTITVHPVNDPPVAQGQGVQINEDTAIEITLTATDQEGSALTYAVVTPPAHGQLSGSAPVLTYTPDLNYHGGDSFTFKANDGGLDSNIATVTITISPINDPPDAQDDTASVLENGSVDITVLSNDTDVDGDTLTISAYDALTPLGGTVTCTGTCIYTPPANTFGSDSFGYTISDGHGSTDSAAVAISIGSSNQAPTAVVDAYSTAEDTLLTVPAAQGVLINDTDPDAGDVLSALKVTDPAHGDLNFNADGSFTYLPDANFNGEDSFSYQVKDAEADGSTAVVTLTVTPVNDAPTCQNAALAVDEDVPAPWAHLCTDIDGDPLNVSVITAPAHGTLNILSNPMLYTPAANYFGADSFTYRVSDGTANSNTAAVTVTIASVNDAPSAVSLSPAAVAEFMPAGTLIGDFSTTDADTADTHTYALVAGAGDTDNASFTITAGQLFTNAVFSQALTPTLSIRVRSTDSGAGNLTLEQVFTITILEGDAAPTLFSPAHQVKLLNNTPTFDWSDVPGADSYTLQISRYMSFAKIFVEQETAVSTLKLTSLLPSKARFYWRVCSHALGTTACSAAWYFTTANPPSTPTLLSPANGATVTSTRPRLDWNDAVLPPTTKFWRYEVQWSTDPNFTAPQNAFVSGWVRRSYYAPATALTRGQTYYWRVRTFNTLGEYGLWSAVGSFRIAP